MITRLIPLALAATLIVGCDASKSGPQSASAPGRARIEIVGGDSVNWGNVSPGVLKHTVKITNTGNDTLKIAEVKPSCGCTTAPLDKNIILPGDTASIAVSVDVAHASGAVNKHMTITSNDSTRPQIVMQLHANLVRDVTAIPEFFPVVQAKAGDETATSIALKNTGTQPVSVGPPRLEDAAEALVRFDMGSSKTLQPGDTASLVAHVRPLKPGVASVEVVVPTSSKTTPDMDLRITIDAK
jgi:hypothetical protein